MVVIWCRSAWDMSPLFTGRHVGQWESSDMSEQSMAAEPESLRVLCVSVTDGKRTTDGRASARTSRNGGSDIA